MHKTAHTSRMPSIHYCSLSYDHKKLILQVIKYYMYYHKKVYLNILVSIATYKILIKIVYRMIIKSLLTLQVIKYYINYHKKVQNYFNILVSIATYKRKFTWANSRHTQSVSRSIPYSYDEWRISTMASIGNRKSWNSIQVNVLLWFLSIFSHAD